MTDRGTSLRQRARATVRTAHVDPETVAAAISPDNTDEMATNVEDGRVVTTIERPSAAGVRTTADDYVTNLQVASRVAEAERQRQTETDTDADNTQTQS